jgi:hypothetical protein
VHSVKREEESVTHLFLNFPFVHQIWTECSASLNQVCRWKGPNIEEAWREWMTNPQNQNIKSLPLIINWGVWLAQNSVIFNEKYSIPEHIVAQSLSILSHFPQGKDEPQVRNVVAETVDQTKPWAYFDGASQNDGQICGGGVVLYLFESHYYNLTMGLGPGTNNYAELMALKLLLTFAGEKGINSLQIFGDSMVVINWIRKIPSLSQHQTFSTP